MINLGAYDSCMGMEMRKLLHMTNHAGEYWYIQISWGLCVDVLCSASWEEEGGGGAVTINLKIFSLVV